MNSIQLTILNGPNEGRRLKCDGTEFVVGRGSTGDFQVIDFRMSREHFRLAYTDGTWQVHDLSSRNGTVVNDERQHLADLRDGDKIVAGDTSFRVDIGQDFFRAQRRTRRSKPANG